MAVEQSGEGLAAQVRKRSAAVGIAKTEISEVVEAMDTIELKFILKLLGFADYRAPLSKIQPNNQTKALDREMICRKLRDRGWVECSYEITKLKTTPPGKALLKLDSDGLPVTDKELKVLRPFDPATFKPGNFWQEQQDSTLNVDSIHQEAIAKIEVILDRVMCIK